METENPLISIIIGTFNSSKYILEALESIKTQTYKNIEVVITDDCSTDNTIDICQNWIGSFAEQFNRVELITYPKNTGVSANCNRGLKASKGEWVKLLGGDDVLINTCIEDCVSYIKHNDQINVLIGAGISFNETLKIQNLFGLIYDTSFYRQETTALEQFKALLISNRPFAPGSFINRKFLLDFDGFNENYRNIEDYPFWIKITKQGHKIYGLPKPVVYYRIHGESIFSHQLLSEKDKIVKDSYWLTLKFRKEIIYPELSLIAKLSMQQTLIRNNLLKRFGNSNKKLICRILVVCFKFFNFSRFVKN